MEKLTKLKFKDDNFEMDINMSTEDNSIWHCQKELALLFNTSQNKISYHINCITKSDLNHHELIRKFRKNSVEHEGKRDRPVSYYNLKIALTIGTRLRSNKALILKEYLQKKLLRCSEKNNESIINYNNGKIDIPINLDLKTENAWVSVKRITTLFDTSLDNVYLHIKNIFNEGEFDIFNNDSVSEDSSVTAQF